MTLLESTASTGELGHTGRASWIERRTREAVLGRLSRIEHGRLALIDGGRSHVFGTDGDTHLRADVRILDPRFYTEVALGGSVGAGEAYMEGLWSSDDLAALTRVLLRNRTTLDGMETGLARLSAPLRKALHWAARNTRAGSRRNIATHYDLGNSFFRLFLDPTLMYSSAVFERPDMSLEEASVAKLDLICRKLDLKAGDHVLEIGTGWGGFALHAASRYGCRVTTTTISRAQHALAKERIDAAGLASRVTLLLDDYRDLAGEYDKLVSIEMIEAVGHQYFDDYFRRCSDLLKPEGRMVLQAITIADRQYDAARKSVDFIKKHIFPGCCIPSVAALTAAVARATDLRLYDLQDIGPHYATTLRAWRENFYSNVEHVRELGFPETFIRMWEFYLAYCEGGFSEQALGDVQMLFVKPLARIEPLRSTYTGGTFDPLALVAV